MAKNPIYTYGTQAARAYGANPTVINTMARLESGGRANAVNNWDSNAKKGTPSKGAWQFIKPTFDAFARQARADNPGAWRGVPMQWLNPKAQALTAAWAVTHGKGSHWATYDRALDAAGGRARGPKGPAMLGGSSGAGGGGGGFANAAGGGGIDPAKAFAFNLIFKDRPVMQSLFAKMQSNLAGSADNSAPAEVPERAPNGMNNATGPSIPGNVPGKRKGESWVQYLDRIATTKFGLRHDPGNRQTTGGRHTAGSEHYSARAVDFGDARNPWNKLLAWKRWAASQGFDTLNEHDHIHVSAPGGGV